MVFIKTKKIAAALILASLLLPLIASASLGLEENYPELPGGSHLTISANSSLSQTIRYFVSWAIIIGAIVAFASLVAGGVLYLTSAGNPGKMKSAQGRILNAFLGLIILLGSYLVLVTINPQLTVLEVKKEPINLGIILFDKEQDKGPLTMDKFNEGIREGDIRYLDQSIPDTTKEFGDITNNKFSKFNLQSIGFFKKSRDNIKAITFKEKNFKGKSNEYSFEGRLDNTTQTITSSGTSCLGGKLKLINVNVENFGGNPPLSIEKMHTGPGVYLLAKNQGKQLYLTEGLYPKLKEQHFNDKSYSIKIENKEDSDFLAVLFEDPNYGGPLKAFFEKEKKYGMSAVKWGNTSKGETTAIINSNTDKPYYDNYGGVHKASSAIVFNLDDTLDPSCQEVRLCTEPEYGGNCLVYNWGPKPIDWSQEDDNIGFLVKPMPVFEARDLPSGKQTVVYKKSDSNSTSTREVKFEDKINSIEIKGDCLVALFENKPEDFNNSYAEGPGKHSEVFTESMEDLGKETITGCGPIKGLGFIVSHSCVSAIAVYPIKK